MSPTAATPPPWVGHWHVVRITRRAQQSRETFFPFGEDAKGRMLLGADHFFSAGLMAPTEAPSAAKLRTDNRTAEQLTRHNGQYFFQIGRWRRTGQCALEIDVEFSTDTRAVGTTLERTLEVIAPDRLYIRTPEFILEEQPFVTELELHRATDF